ncbi:MAG: CDP-glycerol glycerophosphotransferase family protein [Lachnospiraceae bacterium]|nr:CDP-glycerol glycerophosphotransferase family protein [Lachnospiraceae bacterium]
MREKIKRLTPGFLVQIYKKVRYLGITALFFICRLFPVDKKLVVFCSVWGYGDNARYVAEELCARKRSGKDRELKLVFITNRPEQVPKNLPLGARKTNSPAAVLALSRAKVWVDNNRKEAYIRKRRGQYYIQLWHGGIALKKIEGDCEEALGEEYIRRAKKDSEHTDLFVSNSTFCTRMYRRAFWAESEIMECGSPRNDRFVEERAQKQTSIFGSEPAGMENLPLESGVTKSRRARKPELNGTPDSRKIAVYAPTYRGNRKDYCDFNADRLRAVLKERFGGQWEILVRLHPLVAGGRALAEKKGVRDISNAPDLYSFLYRADVLITDYSNTMFEFSMTGKPVFLYADDLEEYRKERGFYFDFDSLPFPRAASEEELFAQISDYRVEDYEKPLQEFFEKVGLKEGGSAAAAVADRVEQVAACSGFLPK